MIHYDSNTRLFHLTNNKISYAFLVNDDMQLVHLHFGGKVSINSCLTKYHRFIERGLTTCVYKGDGTYSYDYLDLEYPLYGNSDYRRGAIQLENSTGSYTNKFKYQTHEILSEKPKIEGLPSFYSNGKSSTLKVVMFDDVSMLELELFYTLFEDHAVILRNSKITNKSDDSVKLERMMSSSIGLKQNNYKLLNLAGAWSQERNIVMNDIKQGCIVIDSARGASSAFQNPFVAVLNSNACEMSGEVYGFNLVYSGNFANEIECNAIGQVRINQGINPMTFAWILDVNESFETPEALLAYSDQGLNGLSQTMHNVINHHLIDPSYAMMPRPVLINNWEATYHDFTEDSIVNIATSAKKLGIDMFALDDGWFLNRNSDRTSLGDWQVDYKKLPNGLDGLATKINDLGLDFGLWVEPEMISVDSELYRMHPDWVLGDPLRKLSHGRHQFILDLCNDEVIDYLIQTLSDLFKSANIKYVKWDMNRNMSEVYSVHANHQKEVMHRYILGLYRLLDTLVSAFPNILFESCSAGGNRVDLGMLAYMPQVWISDNTDGYARQLIQYGTSIAYPLSVMKAHISQNPNHQVMRSTPITTKKNVATFGIMGTEMDLSKITEQDAHILTEHIAFYKEKQELVMKGDFYRLINPFDHNETAWMVISKDRSQALVGYYKTLRDCNEKFVTLKLSEFMEGHQYLAMNIDSDKQVVYYGDELNKIGLCIDVVKDMADHVEDFSSQLWYIEVIANDTVA